ncbi:MAG TPA: DUF4172 domain-containing protein [Gammaproteobacteria bacterium]|nr:DUF4172 domain-containing protein [Gammaproteobacteria bacterium]
MWQQPDWPNFRCDKRALEGHEHAFRVRSEHYDGTYRGSSQDYQEYAIQDGVAGAC